MRLHLNFISRYLSLFCIRIFFRKEVLLLHEAMNKQACRQHIQNKISCELLLFTSSLLGHFKPGQS
jgi:hypothetical protein